MWFYIYGVYFVEITVGASYLYIDMFNMYLTVFSVVFVKGVV